MKNKTSEQVGLVYILRNDREENIFKVGQTSGTVENRIKELIPLVNQIVIIGDKKKYLTALITLAKEPNSNTLDNTIKSIDNVSTIDEAINSESIKDIR